MSRFRKIGTSSGAIIGVTRLFRNDEYLLLVQTNVFSESYTRLYFRDIQGIQVRPGPGRLIIGIILGFFLLLFGVGGLFLFFDGDISDQFVSILISGAPFLVILVFFVVNLLRGRSCRCVAHTAVQTVRLPMINRVAKAARLIEDIRPLIQQFQGSLDEENLNKNLGDIWEKAAARRRAWVDRNGPFQHVAKGAVGTMYPGAPRNGAEKESAAAADQGDHGRGRLEVPVDETPPLAAMIEDVRLRIPNSETDSESGGGDVAAEPSTIPEQS